jgi:L-ribulose-5-phosphate 4-epimerase
MNSYKELQREAYEANMQIPEQKLAIYTFGNVSAFDASRGVMAIKPSGVSYDELRPESMVVVDLDRQIVSGTLRPSSDTATHIELYRHFEKIGGICHTHSPYAVSWAQACREIVIYGTTHADHLTVNVPVTEIMSDEAIQHDYEVETGKQIVKCFRTHNYHETEMVLVACHGPFTWGKDAAKAVYNSRVLEEIAKMALFTEQINAKSVQLKQTLIEKHYLRKHGKDAYYGQS